MPIFSDAESRIKKLVVFAFWNAKPKTWLVYEIMKIIAQVKKDIPKDLMNRESYINGLVKSSNKLVASYEIMNHRFVSNIKQPIVRNTNYRFKNPQELKELMTSLTLNEKQSMWSQAKGYPNVADYDHQVKKFIDGVTDRPFVTAEKGKKPISLWQKAELDVRYTKQMEQLTALNEAKVKYAWLSSHPDCSERCAVWQGELVSLNKRAKNPQKKINKYSDINKDRFLVGELDGHKVYSLPDIMDVVDKYGYRNNIISGFNCRHHLTEYHKGSSAPKEYTEEQVKRQRNIEHKIRMMERRIRLLKMKLNDFIIINDKKAITSLKHEIRTEVENYKRYCTQNGYAWEKYRIDVNDNRIYTRSKNNG